LIPHRFPCSFLGQLRIRARSAEPDFVAVTAEATMKFSVSAGFDRVREYGIMKKRNHTENVCMERPSRCAR